MSTQSRAGRDWIVMLEAADVTEGPGMDAAEIARLAALWPGPRPKTLYSRSRYALQICLPSADAASALSFALSCWKKGLLGAGLPEWELVRAEVMTPEELEHELQAAEATGRAALVPSRQDDAGDGLLRRALYDSVTGLPDRAVFLDEVRRTLDAYATTTSTLAVLVVHLKGLATVVPNPHQPPTESLLLSAAQRLSHIVRGSDTVARVAPGQFAVLARVASEADLGCLVHRITGTLDASVGVALASWGDDADDLVGMAELAVVSTSDPERIARSGTNK